MAECEVNKVCQDQFDRIYKRLDDGAEKMEQHSVGIVELRTDMRNVVKSLDGLTKAIWGACGTAIIILLGFFIWYVQGLK